MKNFITFAVSIISAFSIVNFAQTRDKCVKLDEEFSLVAAQKGFVQSDKLTIEFVSVLEDLRCPTDVDCVWAGSAKVQINVSKENSAAEVFELNTNLEPRDVVYQGYKIELTGLTPAPKSDVDMKTVQYAANFIVSK